jgi:hypothetical protein
MKHSRVLIADAGINLLLGLLLLIFPTSVVRSLGVPAPQPPFYASLLGAIFIGITIALLIEVRRDRSTGFVGLGLGGAVAINLCGGLTLAVWLLSGQLTLTAFGQGLLWALVVVLVGISSAELVAYQAQSRE